MPQENKFHPLQVLWKANYLLKRKSVLSLLFLKQVLIGVRHTPTQFLKGYTLVRKKREVNEPATSSGNGKRV